MLRDRAKARQASRTDGSAPATTAHISARPSSGAPVFMAYISRMDSGPLSFSHSRIWDSLMFRDQKRSMAWPKWARTI